MKIGKKIYAMAILILMLATIGVAQSKGMFIDGTNKFTIMLTEDWRAINYTDAVGRSRTEFVRGQLDDGLLRISKVNLGGRTLAQVVDMELEDLRSYHGKHLLVGREPFEGEALSGIKIAFYYTKAGRQATGAYYFLEDAHAVWILRFTGQAGTLDKHPGVTDQIARSFRPQIPLFIAVSLLRK
jgi:hypothetical protein